MFHEKATFAAGCFWGIEEAFSKITGVLQTRVGYTGGHVIEPTYELVCRKNTGHAEAVEIIYNPKVTSYIELLAEFFSMHSAASVLMQGPENTGQYRSAIFYHNPSQKKQAEDFIKYLQDHKIYGPKIYTQIAPVGYFWEAEEYHQKYHQKHG